MQGRGRLPLLSLLIVLLSTLSAAWPWPPSFEKLDGLILKRETSGNTDSALPTAAASASASASATITSQPTSTKKTSAAESTAAASDSGSAAATTGSPSKSSGKSASTTRHSTKTTPIDPRLPPGGVQMITPGVFNGATYYKVGDFLTFAWNYTSLIVTPTAVDVIASCATNNQMYTIAANQSVTGPTGAVTWDTGEYQSTATIPLLVASYTLVIYDASKEFTAIPSAGYLGAAEPLQFAMYTPQPYVPLQDFKCSTCNGALSQHESQALGVLFITSAITVLSFTWFASGFGLF